MPPVFGPVSPSPMRLKSCAAPSGTARRAVAEREQRDLVALEQLLDHDVAAERRDRAQRRVELVRRAADEDALARGEPVRLDDARRRARPTSVSAVGTPAARITSFAKVFEPSIRAASALGPKTAMPAWRSSSATPATSGASGPMTTRSMPSVAREAEQAVAVVGAHGVAAAERRDARVARARRGARSARALRRAATRARARARPSRRGAPSRGRVYGQALAGSVGTALGEHALARGADADELDRHARARARRTRRSRAPPRAARRGCRRRRAAPASRAAISQTGSAWWKSLWCAGKCGVSEPSRRR